MLSKKKSSRWGDSEAAQLSTLNPDEAASAAASAASVQGKGHALRVRVSVSVSVRVRVRVRVGVRIRVRVRVKRRVGMIADRPTRVFVPGLVRDLVWGVPASRFLCCLNPRERLSWLG